MLAVTEDPEQIARIEKVATAISKSLAGVNNNIALMALCLVISDVVEQGMDPSQWHLTLADINMAIAMNLGDENFELE